MTKMYLVFIILLSLNCMAAEKSEMNQLIVERLDGCIREVQEAQQKQKEFRESKGPIDQLFHFVDSLQYDSFSKTLIGVMEEVKYSIEGSVQGTKTNKRKLSKKQLARFENQLRENHFSNRFLKNKEHFKKSCSYEMNSFNQEVEICEFNSNLTIYGLHKTLKHNPTAFCNDQRKRRGFNQVDGGWVQSYYESIDDMPRGSDLKIFAQNAIDIANDEIETALWFYNQNPDNSNHSIERWKNHRILPQ